MDYVDIQCCKWIIKKIFLKIVTMSCTSFTAGIENMI